MSELLTEQELLAMAESSYMNPQQVAFFKARLLERGKALQASIAELGESLKEVPVSADPFDVATQEEFRSRQLTLLARATEEVRQVKAAIDRIQNDEYGYCEMSGDPIGIRRLLINPVARYDAESQRVIEARDRPRVGVQLAFA